MEAHKHRALLHFLKRSNKSLKSYLKSLAQVVQDLKDSYDPLDPVWQQDTDAFLQLMILDGCFMLEILRTATEAVDDYASNDPIFGDHGKAYIMPFFKYDMLMLENQLPFLVLKKLIAVDEKDKEFKSGKFAYKLILEFYYGYAFFKTRKEDCLHVLDAYRKSIVLWEDDSRMRSHRTSSLLARGNEMIIRSATRLSEAGIQFMPSKPGSGLTNISFHRGVLNLPPIVVDDTTESMFLNQIAFERYHVGTGNAVSSYVFFMGSIIYDARDVSLLHSQGIIHNAMGNEEAVVNLFNSVAKYIAFDLELRFYDICMMVDRHCKKPRNEWRAIIVHTYFTSPWPILLAANLLFFLSVIQTFYSVYGFYHKN
ncbi:hypothetical protein LguiB_000490 [Lonicera macranthoides]